MPSYQVIVSTAAPTFVALALAAACSDGDSTTVQGGEGGQAGASSSSGTLLPASPGVERASPRDDAPVSQLARGFNEAGFALWRTQESDSNLVFSPTSIGHALLMARAAADTETGASIDEGFALPEGLSAHEAWNAVDQALAAAAESEKELTITIADRIWPRLGVTPDQDWIDLLVSQHGADTEALDFGGDASGSRDTINDWVSDQTAGLIPELLPKGFIDASTVLVLTDALYFKARWQTVFGKYQNVTDTFTHLDGSTEELEYLHELELGDRRGEGDGFVGAELPYVGGELSMLLIVPDEGRFSEIRDVIDQDLLDEIDETFTTGPYELLMPPFSTTTAIDLLAWLTDIGAAPGSYPSISPAAFLAGAVHGADITVDEWGTVAAAATALGFDESGPPEPELVVQANRPFLYLIRHRSSAMILFAGQVTDP